MDAATRNHIRFRRSEILRSRINAYRDIHLPLTHEQMVAEIETAIAFAQSNPFREEGYVRPRDAKGHFVAAAA